MPGSGDAEAGGVPPGEAAASAAAAAAGVAASCVWWELLGLAASSILMSPGLEAGVEAEAGLGGWAM